MTVSEDYAAKAKEIARELLRKWQTGPGLARGPSR